MTRIGNSRVLQRRFAGKDEDRYLFPRLKLLLFSCFIQKDFNTYMVSPYEFQDVFENKSFREILLQNPKPRLFRVQYTIIFFLNG